VDCFGIAMNRGYLNKLSRCQSIDKMAMLVRAQGCSIIASLHKLWAPDISLKNLETYEDDARFVENNCVSVKGAKRYLKEKGYF